MPPPRPAQPSNSAGTRRFALPVFLVLLVPLELLLHVIQDRKLDFAVFYYAARMVRDGRGGQLYDAAVQAAYQVRFHRPPDFTFNYPPVALLPFLLLASIPMMAAYTVWTAANLALLAKTARMVNGYLRWLTGDWPVLLALAFLPTGVCLVHGQFSILVFFLFTASFLAWQKGRPVLAGAILAVATFKFQLVVGLMAIVFLKREWKFIAGFCAGLIPMISISVLLAGPAALAKYPSFLKTIAAHAGPSIDPGAMANLRGLLFFTLRHDPPLWAVVLLSAALVVWAARKWDGLESGFAIAVVATVLVSYHSNPQDLTVLLLPLGLAASRIRRDLPWDLVVLFGFIGVPAALLLLDAFALLALPVFVLAYWLSTTTPTQRPSAPALPVS